MPRPMFKITDDTLLKTYAYLRALGLGERYEFSIAPTAHEKQTQVARAQRDAYKHVARIVYLFNRQYPDELRFVMRAGDGRDPTDINKAYIHRVRKHDETVPDPPMPNPAPYRPRKTKLKLPPPAPTTMLSNPSMEPPPDPGAQLKKDLNAAQQEAEANRRIARAVPPQSIITTKSEQLRLFDLIASHARGATIQELRGDKWLDAAEPNWLLPVANLRMKPPPRRELWVLYARGHKGDLSKRTTLVTKREDLMHAYDPECLVHYREVFPDEEED